MKYSTITKLFLRIQHSHIYYTNRKQRLNLRDVTILSLIADYLDAEVIETTIGELAALLDVEIPAIRHTVKKLLNYRLLKLYRRASPLGAPYKIPTLTRNGRKILQHIIEEA